MGSCYSKKKNNDIEEIKILETDDNVLIMRYSLLSFNEIMYGLTHVSINQAIDRCKIIKRDIDVINKRIKLYEEIISDFSNTNKIFLLKQICSKCNTLVSLIENHIINYGGTVSYT